MAILRLVYIVSHPLGVIFNSQGNIDPVLLVGLQDIVHGIIHRNNKQYGI